MKNLKDIIESQNFLVNKKLNNRQDKYEYHPKTEDELKNIIIELLKEGQTDLNYIDISEITDMNSLFWMINKRVTVKDIDISEWDVSNVTDMGAMFSGCYDFNSDLSRWNVSKVTDMSRMFVSCDEFNSDLSNWNVSKVKNMAYMFAGCKKFKCDLSNWKICKDTPIRDMFKDCDALEKNNKIPKWYSN